MADDAGERTTMPTESPAIASDERADGASTVGTGSVLGVGCLVAVVLFVVIAVAIRWLGGAW